MGLIIYAISGFQFIHIHTIKGCFCEIRMTLKCIYLHLILLCVIHFSYPLKFAPHPEADLSMAQKIKKYGYPLEIHEVTTEDNYILTIHRIPHGKQVNAKDPTIKRSPVLLLHGMGSQSEYFILLGRDSIVYYLADRGFDVWLMNSRGTTFSGKHKYLDMDKDPRYWHFSYHEIGIYDIPANIDYIVNKTEQKVFLIGHSQGNTCSTIMKAERPEYNEKVKISVSYAPSFLLKHIDYPFASLFSYLVDLFELIYKSLGLVTLFPVTDTVASLVKLMCSETTYFAKFCLHVLSVIGSHESRLFSLEFAKLVFSVRPVNVAARQLLHYMQGVKTGTFRQYDYGESGNLRRYKTATPPDYNLSNIVSPVALFHAERDDIVPARVVEECAKALPNVILNYKVPYKYFNHIDFLFGCNASTLVYKRTVQLFKDFDDGKLNSNKSVDTK